MKNRSFGQWLIFLLVIGLLATVGTVSSFTLFTLANYSDTVERLVVSIKTGDNVGTKHQLERLHYFYNLSDKWRAQWLADKYLLKDTLYYDVADSYLIGDWKGVKDTLKDEQDDKRAYPYGNASFREAQGIYQAGNKKEALVILPEIAEAYEKALRVCLDSVQVYNDCFDRVWNYDLITNKKDAEEALANPQPGPKPKFMLGPTKDKGPPMKAPGKKDDKGDGLEGEEKGGQGSPRKRP